MIIGLDHLTICMPDLSQGLDWFEALAGVRPEMGGPHAGLGTHNAVLPLGNERYLEFVGIDPGQARPQHVSDWLARVDALNTPTPFAWCFRCDHVPTTTAELNAAGLTTTVWPSVKRTTPDGLELEWAMIHFAHQFGPVIPYLINWGSSTSPGAGPNAGCTLVHVTPVHPDPSGPQAIFDAAHIPVRVGLEKQGGLRVDLMTPNGRLTIEADGTVELDRLSD